MQGKRDERESGIGKSGWMLTFFFLCGDHRPAFALGAAAGGALILLLDGQSRPR
jgi:hypothetical protein